MKQILVSEELLRQVLDLIQGMEQNYGSLWQVSATAEHLDELDGQLRTALEQPAAEPTPIYAFRRKGLDDFCTCSKGRFDELSKKPHLFEMAVFYAAP